MVTLEKANGVEVNCSSVSGMHRGEKRSTNQTIFLLTECDGQFYIGLNGTN